MKSFLLPLVCLCSAAFGDTVVLTDGRKLEGDMKRDGNDWVLTDAQNRQVRLSPGEVKSIELGRRADDAGTARQRLDFLKRYTDSLADAAPAIARYEEFLKQYPGSPLEAEAKKELELWRTRQQAGMVKVGGKWLGDEELAKWEENSAVTLESARQLLRQNRARDAQKTLEPLLAADPANAGALYLQGVVQYKLEQVAIARKSFEAALAVMPDHAATLNNLAVVCWRQKQESPVLALLDRAALNLPSNQRILDNMAEVLNGLAGDARNSQGARRLAKRYEEQEPALERTQEQAGYYRWGSKWVNKAQHDELVKVQKEIAGQLDDLAKEYDRTEASIAKITQDIDANQRTMRRIEVDSVTRDVQGNLVRSPYPNIYYDLQRETDRLTSRRRGEIERLETIKAEAQKVKSKLSVPPYSGSLEIMDETYTPLVLRKRPVAAPAKRASTEPSM